MVSPFKAPQTIADEWKSGSEGIEFRHLKVVFDLSTKNCFKLACNIFVLFTQMRENIRETPLKKSLNRFFEWQLKILEGKESTVSAQKGEKI